MGAEPMGFAVRLSVEDTDLTSVDRAGAAMRDYSLTVDASARTVSAAGHRLTAIGHMLAAPFLDSISLAKEFELSMISVQKITSDTDSATQSLAASLVDLSRGTSQSATELARVAGIAASFGVRGTKQLESFVSTVARLASVTDISAEAAAKAFARISTLYKLEAADVERLGSAISDLENKTTATAQDLISVTERLGPLSSSIGLTVQQALGLAATLRDVGLSSEEAGQELTTVLERMGTSLGGFAAIAKVSGTQFRREFLENPYDALVYFLKGLHDLSERSTPQALFAVKQLGLEGVRSSKAILGLANNIEKLDSNFTTASDGFDRGLSLQQEFERRTRSLSAQFDMFLNRLRAIGISIGTVFIPPAKVALAILSAVADVINLIPAPILALAISVPTLASGMALVAGSFFLVAAGVSRVKSAFNGYFVEAQKTFPQTTAWLQAASWSVGQWIYQNILSKKSIGEVVEAVYGQVTALLGLIATLSASVVAKISDAAASVKASVATALETDARDLQLSGIFRWLTAKALEAGAKARDFYLSTRDIFLKKTEAFWTAVAYGELDVYLATKWASIKATVAETWATLKSIAAKVWEAATTGVQAGATEALALTQAQSLYLTTANTDAMIEEAAVRQLTALKTEALTAAEFGWAAATQFATASLAKLEAVLIANPIGAAVALVVIGAVAFYYLAKRINEGSIAAQALGIFLAVALYPIAPFLSGALVLLIAYRNNFLGLRTAVLYVARAIGFVFGTLVGIVHEVFDPLLDAIRESSQATADLFASIGYGGSLAEEVFGTFKASVYEVFIPFRDFLAEIAGEIRGVLTALGLIGPPGELVTAVAYGMKLGLEAALDVVWLIAKAVGIGIRVATWFFSLWIAEAKIAVLWTSYILSPLWAIFDVGRRIKNFFFQSSMLHLGEGALQVVKMFSPLIAVLMKVYEIGARIREFFGAVFSPKVNLPKVLPPLNGTASITAQGIGAAVAGSARAEVAPTSGEAKASPSRADRRDKSSPVEVTIPITLELDGRTLARIVKKIFLEDEVLGYGGLSAAGG